MTCSKNARYLAATFAQENSSDRSIRDCLCASVPDWASANRDAREFADPDTFQWDRPMRRIVAFGMGPHFCIGIHIARLEGRLIVEELLRRFPDYAIDEAGGERATSEFQIGWVRLPITV